MSLLVVLLVTVMTLSVVSAWRFSPTSFAWNVETGQKVCGVVRVGEDGDMIAVSNTWANSYRDPWSVSRFRSTNEDHNIISNYETTQINDGEIEVCFTFNDPGRYHGVLLIKPQVKTPGCEENCLTTVVQFGIWLKVIVRGDPVVQEPIPEPLPELIQEPVVEVPTPEPEPVEDWRRPESEWRRSRHSRDQSKRFTEGQCYKRNRMIQKVEVVKRRRIGFQTMVYWTRGC